MKSVLLHYVCKNPPTNLPADRDEKFVDRVLSSTPQNLAPALTTPLCLPLPPSPHQTAIIAISAEPPTHSQARLLLFAREQSNNNKKEGNDGRVRLVNRRNKIHNLSPSRFRIPSNQTFKLPTYSKNLKHMMSLSLNRWSK